MTTYAFRAECDIDVYRFAQIAGQKVEFTCSDQFESELSLGEIQDLIRQVPDGHVMLQTTNVASAFTGERNWDIR